jgi:hypothetical protein
MRARFLKSLCNGNQFRFFVDLRLTDDPIDNGILKITMR